MNKIFLKIQPKVWFKRVKRKFESTSHCFENIFYNKNNTLIITKEITLKPLSFYKKCISSIKTLWIYTTVEKLNRLLFIS